MKSEFLQIHEWIKKCAELDVFIDRFFVLVDCVFRLNFLILESLAYEFYVILIINGYKNDHLWLLQNKVLILNFNTMNSQPKPIISNRERQVLQMVALGKRSLDIASQFELSVHTINNHRKNMLRKTGCSNTTQLINWGVKQGLIQ